MWRNSSERAFAQLVDSTCGLSIGLARRDLQDDSLPEDVAQVVFILLARKAPTLNRNVSIFRVAL